MGEGHVLGIDALCLEDGNLLVLHCVNKKEPEIGRVTCEDAVGALLKEHLYRYTLAEALGGRPWTELHVPRISERTVEENDTEWVLPSHIPFHTRLQEDKVILFSLIKLTDEEISVLKQNMDGGTNEVTIYNWPHETPASQAETYNIFQCVKPEAPVAGGQTFVMFIDASGSQRAPVIVVGCESASEGAIDGSRSTRTKQMQYKHIYLHAEKAQQDRALWPLIWHSPSRGSVNDVIVNYPLFYGSCHHFNNATAMTDWNDPVMRYQPQFIARPGLAICATGATFPEYMIYILSPVTPEELPSLRDILLAENADIPQFIELNLVSRETRTERKVETDKQRSVGPSTRLDPLLEFFNTPAYLAVADPPDTFVFLDNDALDNLLSGASDDDSVPLATIYNHYHLNGSIAVEQLGNLFADIVIGEGLELTLANLSVGNMWFGELVGCYGIDMDVSF